MELLTKILNKEAKVGIIGLGYVGFPLGLEFAGQQYQVIGFDLDDRKVSHLNAGKSYIKHISSKRIKNSLNCFSATSDFSRLTEVDAIIIAVPTPLDEHREPDISYVANSAKTISQYLQKGQLVVLESSTYPGTTEEILLPLFEKAPSIQAEKFEFAGEINELEENIEDYKVGEDFYLAFSPEREDPNNPIYNTATIPKVVGGVTANCLKVTQALYDQVIVKTV
ncbi:MAG: nucleotide sugar dehydrogenase, partial [Syntrophothermus sp.]